MNRAPGRRALVVTTPVPSLAFVTVWQWHPGEAQLIDELGDDVGQLLASLDAKGWIVVRLAAASAVTVIDLTGLAWKAVRSRRDVGR